MKRSTELMAAGLVVVVVLVGGLWARGHAQAADGDRATRIEASLVVRPGGVAARGGEQTVDTDIQVRPHPTQVMGPKTGDVDEALASIDTWR